MNIQKQQGFKDCGLFAIANATSICYGDDPTALVYEQHGMRQHLLNCLEKEEMTTHDVSHSRKEESVAEQHRVIKSITNENQHDLHLALVLHCSVSY